MERVESNQGSVYSDDQINQRKRTRRNAIKPNSVDSDLLRQFSLQYQMNTVRIDEPRVEEVQHSVQGQSSSPSTPSSPQDDDPHRKRPRTALTVEQEPVERKDDESSQEEERPETDESNGPTSSILHNPPTLHLQ